MSGEDCFIKLQENINYRFRNPELLRQALTHSSYANEKGQERIQNNERLEYLGDAVLEMAISLLLYNYTPLMAEGEMTKLRSRLVCEQSLCNQAQQIGLGSFLFLGRGEESSGGRERPSILADAFEAVVAAIFLDGGFEPVASLIDINFSGLIGEAAGDSVDYKTILQEQIQNRHGLTHTYKIVNEDGPDHSKTFTADVLINGKVRGTGTGKSKKSAEQAAAKEAMKYIERNGI